VPVKPSRPGDPATGRVSIFDITDVPEGVRRNRPKIGRMIRIPTVLAEKLQRSRLMNAYEARFVSRAGGTCRASKVELAPAPTFPRQKIYEVLDSLVEKGCCPGHSGETKLFSAVEPNLAIPGYLDARTPADSRAWSSRTRAVWRAPSPTT